MTTKDKHIQDALRNLDNADFVIRKRAIQTLARERYEPAVPRLVDMLNDHTQHERVRAIVARALGKIGTDEAYTALVTALSQIDPAILSRQVIFNNDSSDTYKLHNTMLSVALTVALKYIGTPDARRALSLWRRGELTADQT